MKLMLIVCYVGLAYTTHLPAAYGKKHYLSTETPNLETLASHCLNRRLSSAERQLLVTTVAGTVEDCTIFPAKERVMPT